jgi:ankyrin repeat protein
MNLIKSRIALSLVVVVSLLVEIGISEPPDNNCPACKAVLSRDLDALSSFSPDTYGEMRARTSNGIPSTPLHLAVEQGDVKVVKRLTQMNVDWNAADQFKGTPLLHAVMYNRKDIVEILIKGGANPNAATQFGTSAYCYAPSRDAEIMKMLLETGVKPDNSNALVNAIASGNLSMVKKLYPVSYMHIRKQENLLDIAANIGHDDIIKYLAKKFKTSRDRTRKLIKRARDNRDRYEKYINRHSVPVEEKLVNDERSGKKGYYKYKIKEFSPYTEEQPDPYLYDIPVSVYVPEEYSEKNPPGLLIYISGGYPNREYRETLDSHNLIWAGVNCYSFKLGDILREKHPHIVFTLAMVYDLARHYRVDPSRIYLAGFSWGGRLTGRILYQYPNIFRGGIASGGCQVVNRESSDAEGMIDAFEMARRDTALVITAGDNDHNREEAYSKYDFLLRMQFRNVYYIQEPGRGHAPLTGENFDRALGLLDNRKQ